LKKKSKKEANTERQRLFKEKMYNAGLKQRIVWVKRDTENAAHATDVKSFIAALQEHLKYIPKEQRAKLFEDLLSMSEYAAWKNDLEAQGENI
jgi:hypothetical protein